ncbi:MAG: hypothetical protein ACOC9Q_03645 [bacterium]
MTALAGLIRDEIPMVGLAELELVADVVVECAPAELLLQIVEPFVVAGEIAIVLSSSSLQAP